MSVCTANINQNQNTHFAKTEDYSYQHHYSYFVMYTLFSHSFALLLCHCYVNP